MAIVKYESDTYKDAGYWIATRNGYGPLVERESTISDTPPRFTLNKNLRSINQSNSSKSNNNLRKPLPSISIKRPALSEPKKQVDGKRLKLDEAAQSSSAVVNNANAEPGFTIKGQPIIIQYNQSMECAQTEETAAAFNDRSRSPYCTNGNLQEYLPKQVQQEMNMPLIDVDSPTVVIDDDQEVQPTSMMEQQLFSVQVLTQFTNQSELVQQPQISVAPSMKMTRNGHKLRTDDVLNNEPTSHNLPGCLKMSAHLYSHMNGARRLIPIHEPVEKRILTNQDNSKQELLRGSTESNNYKHRPNSRTIKMWIPSNRQNSKHSSNPSYHTSELPQQIQLQSNQQTSQEQSQKPKIRIGIFKKPAPILSKVLNLKRQALSTTHENYLINEQQLQASQHESVLVNGNHRNVMNNACQTDECMVEEPLSSYHAVISDSDYVTDHEVNSDHEMSPDEAPVETTNNVYCTGIASGRSSADRAMAAQNLTSPNHQTHPRVVLEQQMLDNFATLFTQMGSTLRYTCDMYHNLRSSILDTAETYKKLLDAVERFNVVGNSTSSACPSSNITPEVPQATEEINIEVTHDEAPAENHNSSWRFVLPPGYNSHDTRWTLKYQTNLPGLVELMAESGIYVSYGELKYCQQVSKDCKSLARRLLLEVFNREALAVCLSMSEKPQASNNVGSNVRPSLDDHASNVLLNFVLEYGLQCGWNTDLQPIVSTLHNKIQEIRFRQGVIVKC